MSAVKPLSGAELLSAVRVDFSNDTLDLASKIAESSLLALCKNMLVLDSRREVWRFFHLSVDEYLEQNHWNLQEAHCSSAKVCLKVLIEVYKDTANRDGFGSLDEQSISSEKFRRDKESDQDNETDSEPPDMFDPTHAFQGYLMLYWVDHDWWDNAETTVSQTNTQGDDLLILAALAGCKPICKALVKRETQPNLLLWGGKCGNAIVAASYQGNKEMVELLIRNGAGVNFLVSGGYFGSALAAAARRGKSKAFKVLLDNGTDINLVLSNHLGSALISASLSGELEIIKSLIDSGADVDLISNAVYRTALTAASLYERNDIVKLLIVNGANANLPLSGQFGSALIVARYYAERATIELLIENGADINRLAGGDSKSALAAAAFRGWKECVESLLDAGAQMNLEQENSQFRAALQAPRVDVLPRQIERRLLSGKGDEETFMPEQAEVAELLLRHGALDEI
ncbi:ankyrin repeat-containing domain protein [Dactylonectria estremocensis]|uniref:Ankyrin repeat-containing domain protein n=1 Tax=Dactylonectria estremocensis TaxID=1079267 RepID=A0A9P9F1E8_9HYPO|nr:ankyrin repeat-containing domain protein [Dactylonectria estremocensis]